MVLLGFLVFLYVSALLILMWGFSKLSGITAGAPPSSPLPSVSIVVSARNEALNLPGLLSCLFNQDYPAQKLEILVVDDRSEDETWSILARAEQEHRLLRSLRITDLMPDFAPKKRALDLAIRSTHGEIILLTDADCTPPPSWARTMIGYYRSGVGVILGYSPYRFDKPSPGTIQGILALDYFSLASVAAASVGLGRPLTATGTNLSYRRSTFLESEGFENIKRWVSGDDDLFIHHAGRQKSGGFSYALSREAFVPAAAPTRWRQFWNQRIRYASKARQYNPLMVVGLVAVYSLNALIALGAASVAFGPGSFFWSALAGWIVKSGFEFAFLAQTARRFGEQHLLKYFLPTAILHPFYVTVFGLLGLFAHYRWKGVTFSKRVPVRPHSTSK